MSKIPGIEKIYETVFDFQVTERELIKIFGYFVEESVFMKEMGMVSEDQRKELLYFSLMNLFMLRGDKQREEHYKELYKDFENRWI